MSRAISPYSLYVFVVQTDNSRSGSSLSEAALSGNLEGAFLYGDPEGYAKQGSGNGRLFT
jgi:hypothetical protein